MAVPKVCGHCLELSFYKPCNDDLAYFRQLHALHEGYVRWAIGIGFNNVKGSSPPIFDLII
jgi:hypothetical protein